VKLSAICTITAAIVLFAGASQAQGSCPSPNSVLNGTYGRQLEGMVMAGNTSPAIGDFNPIVQVGYLTFDGDGKVSGEHDTSFGGGVLPHADPGTYSVNPDCTTGTIFFANNGTSLAFVITGGGEEIKLLYTTAGAVTPGRLRRMGLTSCSSATLGGKSYGYSTHGLIGAGGSNAFPRVGGFVPFADVGQMSFLADGTVTGVEDTKVSGNLLPAQQITGTYTVNADCTGSTNMTIGGLDRSWHFVIVDGGNQMIFIATPTGLVWTGTLDLIE
jgi:hypothetical protein